MFWLDTNSKLRARGAELCKALSDMDRPSLERLTRPDAEMISADGVRLPLLRWYECRNRLYRILETNWIEQAIDREGNIAIISGLLSEKVIYSGTEQARDASLRALQIWRRSERGWRLALMQACSVVARTT